MNKKFSFRFLIITLAATLTISFILPFNHIYSDNNTYTELNSPSDTYGCIVWAVKNSNSKDYSAGINTYSINSRVIHLKHNNWFYTYIVSMTYFNGGTRIAHDCSTSPGAQYNASTQTYNGITYYIVKGGSSPLTYSDFTFNTNIPIVETDYYDQYEYAYRYTYGDLSIDPTPPVQPGILTVNYYTDFASNTQNTINSMKSNRDTITWDYDFGDSNISALDLRVDIRAIPVNYYSSTEQDLKSLSWNSLNLNASLYADLGSYHINYNMRKVSFTWEEVVNRIKYISNLPDIYNNLVNDWNFKIFNLNNYYYWTGWVYQIRLNTESGDYTGEWQTIYQVSSAPPDSATTTINYYVNGNGMTEPVYQTIQNINNQNNVTNNTWYVNGSPYDIDPSTGQSWWEQLLQFITNIVSEILGFLGSIFDSVITGVLEFIHDLGIDFLGLFENLISNIVDLFGNIDLTGNDYTIPEEYTDDLNTYNTWTTGVFNIFFSSGLALFVLIPLILMIVRLVL